MTDTRPGQEQPGRPPVTDGWTEILLKSLDRSKEIEQTPEYRLIAKSREDGASCAKCGHPFGAEEDAWRGTIPTAKRTVFGDVIEEAVLLCGECKPAFCRWRQGCPVCGRTVWYQDERHRTGACCNRCRRSLEAARKRELRAQERKYRSSNICAECSEWFMPFREDARYCSNACRQRAHRERKRLAREAGKR